MRYIQFFIVLTLGLFLGSCGKEDNRVCTQADFFGTFTGSTVCGNGGVENSTVIVSAGSTDTELSIDVDGSFLIVEIDGCSFSGSEKDSNADLVYEGELNGDVLELTLKGLVFMIPVDCTATGRRQ